MIFVKVVFVISGIGMMGGGLLAVTDRSVLPMYQEDALNRLPRLHWCGVLCRDG